MKGKLAYPTFIYRIIQCILSCDHTQQMFGMVTCHFNNKLFQNNVNAWSHDNN